MVLSQKMYPLKFGSCPVFYEITVFSFVINQSDRPEPRKELHRITKSFSINGLYWWNFICTTKMLSHVYITLYFRNTNLLHFSQELPSNKILTLHKKPSFPSPRISWKAQKDQVNITFTSTFWLKKDRIFHHRKAQNKNLSVTSKYHLSINFLPQKIPYFPSPKNSKQ